jgi:hypothetical protein
MKSNNHTCDLTLPVVLQVETTLEPVVSKLEEFVLYETHSHMYLVGCDKLQSQYRCV